MSNEEELDLLRETVIQQKKYIQDLKDLLDTYEDIVKEHIATHKSEMDENRELWQKYLDGDMQ
jgi:ElaB/YqjD/DUF883 family membrane-anchored ribosome-binding protein